LGGGDCSPSINIPINQSPPKGSNIQSQVYTNYVSMPQALKGKGQRQYTWNPKTWSDSKV